MKSFKNWFIFLFSFVFYNSYSQIITDSNPPFDSPIYIVDSILLGQGV